MRSSARRAPPPPPASPPTIAPCSMPCFSASHPGSTDCRHMPEAPKFWTKPGLLSGLFLPLGWGHAALSAARRRFSHAWRASVPVICVGNLVAGGAGKTPVSLSLARILTEAGLAPHILSRGYRARLKGPLQVDPARHSAAEVGDEPLLLARAAPTWIGADRVGSARASAIVLMGRPRPDLVLAGKTVLRATLAPRAGDIFKGKSVIAFAGIGQPKKFFATLEEIGAVLAGAHPFADHHPYRDTELARLAAEASENDAALVTTEKDWVRIAPAWRQRASALKVEVEWADEAALRRVLAPALERAHG